MALTPTDFKLKIIRFGTILVDSCCPSLKSLEMKGIDAADSRIALAHWSMV